VIPDFAPIYLTGWVLDRTVGVNDLLPPPFNGQLRDQKRGLRAGPPLPTPGTTLGFMGSKPSCCNFLRASLRARRMASAFSRTLLSEGFS
jgi:hypothetical protein